MHGRHFSFCCARTCRGGFPELLCIPDPKLSILWNELQLSIPSTYDVLFHSNAFELIVPKAYKI